MGKASRASGGSHADGTVPPRQTTYMQNDVAIRGDVDLIGSDSDLRLAGRSLTAPVSIESLAHQPGVARWRQKLAKSRSGGLGALSAIILVLGDSRVRGNSTYYRNAWPDLLRRRFLGATPGSYGFLPASGNLGQVTDGGWTSGDNPWTFAGAVTGDVDYGLGFHAATIPSGGGSATMTFFGDRCTVFYTRTADGPTACAITIDGTSVGPLNARGTELPGQQTATLGTHGNYGFHTLVITPNDGPLKLEGVQWYDGDAPFFASGAVQIFDGSHSGFQAAQFAGSNNNWSAMLAGADTFMGMALTVFDVNDIAAQRTPAQFRDDLVTIAQRVDTRLGTQQLAWTFCTLPSSVDTTAYVDAARQAAATIGLHRASVFDLAALRPGRTWGSDLSSDGTHPVDAGQIWIADTLGQILDPTPVTVAPTTPKRFVIDANTPADGRLAWTAAVAPIAGTAWMYDEATAGALRERRHRVWLDPGTYQAVLSAEHATGRGTLEVLIGSWPAASANTPTLTSCGTVDTSTPAGPAVTTTVLGTQVTTVIGGWAPVVIRKTNAANVGRPVELAIYKTA